MNLHSSINIYHLFLFFSFKTYSPPQSTILNQFSCIPFLALITKMKSMNLFLLTLLIMVLAITLTSAISSENEEPNSNHQETSHFFLSRKQNRVSLTCDKYPKICHIKGSAGSDCCNNRCVNFTIDMFNCGRCGKKCSFPKICCDGKCVNPRSNEKHCGKCGNKCDNRGSCVYGMCSYA
ncbi:unnamed protein product [Vicia faba]|uniref:Stigma-specific Stig1 family protein n=1 Tax=Vicia faba TaxID=3906 RepID=A0AAV0Z002_VICFA|nr:unnamed protein product [Vicia faba]